MNILIPSSVTATNAREGLSNRYGFIPTNEVIDAYRSDGWSLIAANEVKARKPERQGFQKHLLRFVHESQKELSRNERIETIFINSHDGTSSVQIASGIFRFACANGIIVADSTVNSFALRHNGLSMDKVLECSHQILSQQEKVAGVIETWKNLKVDLSSGLELAKTGIELRWGKDATKHPIGPEKVLFGVRRTQDIDDNLWTVFNRVQENILRGGLIDGARQSSKRWRATREIKSIDAHTAINRGLWEKASELALVF